MTYLDTHVLLWLYAFADKRISHAAVDQIRSSDLLLVSPMALLELTYIKEIGRMNVTSDVIFCELERSIGLRVCAQPFGVVVSTAQQQTWTRDPFDRIIVGQAAVKNSMLITKDKTILDHYEYAVW